MSVTENTRAHLYTIGETGLAGSEQISMLEEAVARLEQELAALKKEFADFRKQFE
jgi:hypothetical protein